MEKVHSDRAPAAVGPYSQAIKAGGLLFASGQLPLDPVSGKIVGGGIRDQFEQVIANARAVLAAAGRGLDDVVKTTVFLRNIADFAAMNEVYAKHFSGPVKPARSAFEVAGLPMAALVEMEFIATLYTDVR